MSVQRFFLFLENFFSQVGTLLELLLTQVPDIQPLTPGGPARPP
jgi:hypothetical protein